MDPKAIPMELNTWAAALAQTCDGWHRRIKCCQGAYVLLVCYFVGLCVGKITQKILDRSLQNLKDAVWVRKEPIKYFNVEPDPGI